MRGRQQTLNVALMFERTHSRFAHQILKRVVARHEIRFGVHFDQCAFARRERDAD